MLATKLLRPVSWLLLITLYSAGTLVHSAPFQGRIVKSVGQVSVTTANGETVDPGSTGNVVLESQTINTGPNGRAVVSFNNGSITVLDANSRLRVRTPNWFVHLAGKAFFAFKKLVGAAESRQVQNTVALIGIRGTEFISYAGGEPAVALEEGVLNVQTLGEPFNLTEQGISNAVDEFILDAGEMVTFQDDAAAVTAFTPEVLADLASFKVFGGGLLNDFDIDFSSDDEVAEAQPETQPVAAGEDEPPASEASDDETSESAVASRGGSGFYAGLGGGLALSDSDSSSIENDLNAADASHGVTGVDFEDESSAAKLFAGYFFNSLLGVEVGYVNLGEFSSSLNATPSDQAAFAQDLADIHPVSAEGVYVAGVVRANFVLFALSAKAGVFAWEGEVEAELSTGPINDSSRDGSDPVVGIGFEPFLLPLRVEYERFELEDHPVDLISANLVFNF